MIYFYLSTIQQIMQRPLSSLLGQRSEVGCSNGSQAQIVYSGLESQDQASDERQAALHHQLRDKSVPPPLL